MVKYIDIEYTPFQHILAKSPGVSSMDYCTFGLLKIALSKRPPTKIGEPWKVVKEEWTTIPLKVYDLLSSKSR